MGTSEPSLIKPSGVNMRLKILAVFSFIATTMILLMSCQNKSTTIVTTTATSTAATTSATYTISELKYKLLDAYPDYFWCDPDLYPVARPGVEQQNAIEQFATIEADQEEFSAILNHLNLPIKADYPDEEKLQIYREFKKLNGAVQVMPAASRYTFTIRTGQNEGKTYQGTISTVGVIMVTSETDSLNTCPICLAAGTLIDTPEGQIPVEELEKGMLIYTVDANGKKITGVISEMASVPASSGFKIIHIVLNDGRGVSASPGHPTPDGRAIGDLKDGDALDGAIVVSVSSLTYNDSTFDILPDGGTGLYWANNILLKSTLAK